MMAYPQQSRGLMRLLSVLSQIQSLQLIWGHEADDKELLDMVESRTLKMPSRGRGAPNVSVKENTKGALWRSVRTVEKL
ncbi:uncharacterized protein EV420DRAFT_1573943 [Desarmillaria tabescens]|uniref:Uncharacterized protein n=1 Tax=Armillaria tabescens TaxID=1929756 RepID=A0AA39MRP9_ARMTA|nr:uncharacterized protein EV420DRAFT_1573943 [Desarmillaria tabescens]KAK0444616.1 hypothetical protein EV420DRAFT_1573943 [Desarmillaria tabescens]